jgi:predicted DNA-binding transcriptional regulator AlpA
MLNIMTNSDNDIPTENTLNFQERFLRFEEVNIITGLTKQIIYREMKAKRFPASYKLTERSVGWKYSEVMEWVNTRNKTN